VRGYNYCVCVSVYLSICLSVCLSVFMCVCVCVCVQTQAYADEHRFEKVSNIIKQFKLSCTKSQAEFHSLQVPLNSLN
jgi:hypothetical protein